MTFTMSFFSSSSYLYTFWLIFSSAKSTNSPSTLLGSRRAASSRWLGWICQTRTKTSAGHWQLPRKLSGVNRAVWLCSGAVGTTHFTSTNCVRGCLCAVTYDVVRSRSNRTHAKYRSHSHYARRRTRPYVVNRRNRDMLNFCALLYVRRRASLHMHSHLHSW